MFPGFWLGLCPENKISGGKVLYTVGFWEIANRFPRSPFMDSFRTANNSSGVCHSGF
jgi:hypothetical protein